MDIFGAPGSIITDMGEGVRYLTKGEIMKGFERAVPNAFAGPVRAIRESTEGVTSKSNVPLFYGTEKVKFSPWEAALKALSFTPARTTMIREKQWGEKKRERVYSENRTDIYARIREFFNQPPRKRSRDKWADILEDIRRYNMKAWKIEGMTQIRRQDIITAARKSQKPPKKERIRAMSLRTSAPLGF